MTYLEDFKFENRFSFTWVFLKALGNTDVLYLTVYILTLKIIFNYGHNLDYPKINFYFPFLPRENVDFKSL